MYLAALKPGDTILGMNLSHGGHLTHGHPLNFSGKYFNVVAYGVRKEDERIDYEELKRLAVEHKPKVMVVGASAYPRTIDFAAVRAAADASGALVMADIAHIAGLVAAGLHPSPVPHCEFVTTTTHKTLRGPRGRDGPVPRELGEGDRQGRVPRRPGRAAHARDRGEGGGVQGSADPGVEGVPAADRRQRVGARDGPAGRGLAARLRRHRHPPDARRRLREGHHRQGGREGARQGRDHREQEHDPLRHELADGRLRHPPRARPRSPRAG